MTPLTDSRESVGRYRHNRIMASTICAFCNRHSHMTGMWAENFAVRIPGMGSSQTHAQGVAKCDNCGRASLGVSSRPYGGSVSKASEYLTRAADDTITWYPRTGAAPEFPDVPEHIARAAKEAHSSQSINSLMAAILMARTVVEATAKEKGITTGSLLAKIDELANQSIIRSDTKDAAHEIRHLGNDMAHGDISDLPDSDDVADVLALMDEVLNEVFQGPAKTARLRARRTPPIA